MHIVRKLKNIGERLKKRQEKSCLRVVLRIEKNTTLLFPYVVYEQILLTRAVQTWDKIET